MTKKVEVLIWDEQAQEYRPVHISNIRDNVDSDAMIVGGRFRIAVNSVVIYSSPREDHR